MATEIPGPTRIHPEYAAQLARPGVRPWFDLAIGLTDHPEETRPNVEANIVSYLRRGMPGLRNFPFRFEWVQDPAVRNIVGRDIAVPTLALSPFEHDAFVALTGKQIGAMGSLTIPTEVAMNGGIVERSLINPTKVVILPDATHDTPEEIPFEQRRRNGIVGALDPNALRRQIVEGQPGVKNFEGILLGRMVAVVGELSGPEDDSGSINVLPGYWLNVVNQMESVSSALVNVLGLSQDQLNNRGIAQALTAFVSKQSKQHRNSDVVRLLMSCINFAELETKLAPTTIEIDLTDIDEIDGTDR